MASDSSDPTPPIEPIGADLLAEPPRWPKVVGIISIVWGSLGLLCGGCGIAGGIASSYMSGIMPAEMGPMPDAMKPTAAQLVLAGASILWALLLLVAGIMCVSRHPGTRPMHLIYAVGAIILTVIGTFLSVRQQAAAAEWAAQNPDSPWARQSNPALGWAILAFSVVLGLAWPLFCLVWFAAVKRRPDDLTGGHAPAA